MVKKTIKISILILFIFAFCIGTYQACFFIAEKYFFDKVFYQKSAIFGYNPKEDVPLSSFGKRSRDLPLLTQNTDISNINKFKVVIIGDSYVWGSGIKNNSRFASILEKKLNKIRPTQVFSFAKPGWNILEYNDAYKKIETTISPDLTIFSLVNNDIFVYPDNKNDPIYSQCSTKSAEITPTFDIVVSKLDPDTEADKIEKEYVQNNYNAWANPINNCIIDHCLSNLPTKNAIYFITEDYFDNWDLWTEYKKHLTLANKYIVSSSIGINLPKYTPYWKKDPWVDFSASKSEHHPGSAANMMYADILYNEITTNQDWKFMPQ